jgi:Uma2 family endonuclease
MRPPTAPTDDVFYPESDGEPMSDNTRQFWWIYLIAANLAALFRDRADVFVAGNQNWYPVQGEPETCAAPDAYVVFGRPKGHRGSYKQWEEDNIPMTVVFEVLSPKNTAQEMADKLAFYDTHGVEEYYLYDPDHNHLSGYVRSGSVLLRVRGLAGHVSPRLGIRFDLSGPELVIRYPDGRPFLFPDEFIAQCLEAQQRAEEAENRIKNAKERIRQTTQRTARVTELSLKLLRQQATPEELSELQRLLENGPSADAKQG